VELSARLARLGLCRGIASVPPPRPKGPTIEELLAGETVETGMGTYLRTEEAFPLDHLHGAFPLALLLDQPAHAAARLARDRRLEGLDFQQAVFLDTETTGLARGTGTYVFLVGVGYFADNAFRVVQFFMRQLGEEQAMLQALADLLGGFKAIISFNGRAFDLPLLHTRFILTRMSPCLDELPHFDLLPPARRLWRSKLTSCALGILEAEVLEVCRGDSDIPSWQIPTLYANYLRHGDAREMARVFYHNQQDVLSIVTLAGHMCRLFTNPWTVPTADAAELYSLGRVYEMLSLTDEAERAYRTAYERSPSQTIRDHALRHLSFLLKRQGRWQEAVRCWWSAVAGGRQLYPYVELAKYYEWHARDYSQAAKITRSALERLRIAAPGPQRRRAKMELRHRLSRLERKMEQRYRR